MFQKLHDPGADTITIEIDGVPIVAELGESVAAVLLRQPAPWTRLTLNGQNKRAPFCLMGVCFECLAEIDGVGSVQTCLRSARNGMRVVRQMGRRAIT